MTILGASVQIPPGVTVKPSDQVWTPVLLNATFWWRADTVTLVDGKVSQTIDRTGNGNTASQSDPALRMPVLNVDPALGGRAAMLAQFGQLLVADTSLALAWIGMVCYHEVANFGGIFEVLAAREASGNYFFQGAPGTQSWQASTIAGTRKTNGVVTNVAFTGARQASFYEFLPTVPVSGALHLGNNNAANTGWEGGIAEVFGMTTVPPISDQLSLRAYLTGYYSRQM